MRPDGRLDVASRLGARAAHPPPRERGRGLARMPAAAIGPFRGANSGNPLDEV
jgi:hypothetical protein